MMSGQRTGRKDYMWKFGEREKDPSEYIWVDIGPLSMYIHVTMARAAERGDNRSQNETQQHTDKSYHYREPADAPSGIELLSNC